METGGKIRLMRKRLVPQMQLAFFSALLFGLVAHGMGLWNKLSWHDDIQSLFWEGSTISSGRWMLHVLSWLEKLVFGDGHFSLPLLNGLFSLVCIGSAAALLVHLLKIRRKFCCVGLGCLMAVFPTVTGLFGYMFTIHDYMLAMGMMVLSAYLLCVGEHWWMKLAAVLLGGCSMGIYQAFFPMMLSILILGDLAWLTDPAEKETIFLKRVLWQALCVAGVIGFYFAMNRLFLHKFDLQANSYMGINEMNTTPLRDYLSRVGTACREFFWPTRFVSADMYPMHAFFTYLAMLCGDLLMGLWQGIRLGRQSRGKALLFLIMLLFFPLANNFIYVMSERVHGLMTYSLVMQAVLFLWLVDRVEFRDAIKMESAARVLRQIVSGAAGIILGLTCLIYIRFDNQCYLKATFQQQQAISFFTTLSTQIRAVPGYRDDAPVVFLNEGRISDQTLYNISELDFIHLAPYGETMEGYVNSYAWHSFMERWCGFGPAWADPTGYAEMPEVKSMPHYPDDGSIRWMGDVIVVNF